jgi:hypothetical protein
MMAALVTCTHLATCWPVDASIMMQIRTLSIVHRTGIGADGVILTSDLRMASLRPCSQLHILNQPNLEFARVDSL